MRVRWSWRARAALIAVLLVALLSSSRVLFGRDATPVVVRVTAAQRGDLTAAVTATGSVQSARTVDINAFTISLPALRDRRSDNRAPRRVLRQPCRES
jgi:transcriptional regulator of acetoin/glycerol metabolism